MSATYRPRPRRRDIAGVSRRAGLLAILSALVLLIGQFVASADPPDQAADHGNGSQVSEEHRQPSPAQEPTSGAGSEAISEHEPRSEHASTSVETPNEDKGGGKSKITICHATASVQNPYVEITVSVAAADGIAGSSGNHADHFGEHQGPIFDPAVNVNGDHWGDIIPDVDNDGNQMPHDGLNWDAEGRAILAAGCEVAGPSPSPSASPTPSPSVNPGPSQVPSAVVLGQTVTAAPTRTPPGGIAFTGPGPAVPLTALALALLTLGTGLVWLGRRRRQEV